MATYLIAQEVVPCAMCGQIDIKNGPVLHCAGQYCRMCKPVAKAVGRTHHRKQIAAMVKSRMFSTPTSDWKPTEGSPQ